ncbi:DUF4403 family protein [Parabacteroides sp. FAFU027]|uniref:DUF4403 family protein n=1 Tax=Parabacteroides sp. FAFU027 TaxID=2922715 RepID=UPI001FAF739E|nr:DUF4403 family protein [Parabacteroides sp. FAFU027]
MRKISLKLFVALLAVVAVSCKTAQIEKPRESYIPSGIAPAVSELPLQVELDVKKLEAAINQKMNGLIFEGSNVADKDLTVKVWKAQPFTFTINNNVIEYRVPLKIWTRFAWKVQKLGITLSDNYEANGTIALSYKTAITLDKNWKLVAKTTSNGYQWIETPKLNVAGISVPVGPVANLALTRCEKIIDEKIDKALSDAVDLKKYVSQAWSEVQKPMQVSPENQMWLKVTPKDVYVSPFITNGNKLNMAISLYSQIESVIGAQPLMGTKTALPEFKYVNRPPQQFTLNLAADVTFEKIAEMAKKQLVNQTFEQAGKKITIKDLSIYGSNGKAIFIADLIGSIKGKVYFTGNLTFNKEKNAIEITEPEFDIKTKNVLAKSANWLLHGMILNKITPYLTYPVTDQLKQLTSDTNKMLANYSVYPGVSLQGKLSNVTVENLSLVPGAVRMLASAKGNVGVKLADLKF